MSKIKSVLSIFMSLISGIFLASILQITLVNYITSGQVYEFLFYSISTFFDPLSLFTYVIWVLMGVIVGVVDHSTDSNLWSVIFLGILSWGIMQASSILLGLNQIPETSIEKITFLLSMLVLIPPIIVGGITAKFVRDQIRKIRSPSGIREVSKKPFSGSICPKCNTKYRSNPRICYNCGYEFRSKLVDSQE